MSEKTVFEQLYEADLRLDREVHFHRTIAPIIGRHFTFSHAAYYGIERVTPFDSNFASSKHLVSLSKFRLPETKLTLPLTSPAGQALKANKPVVASIEKGYELAIPVNRYNQHYKTRIPTYVLVVTCDIPSPELFIQIGKSLELIYTKADRRGVDPLTNFYRRGVFDEDLASAIQQAQKGNPLSLIYFDYNGLKEINDTKGHHVGDQRIQEAAEAIITVAPIRDTDRIYRYAGDELIAVLKNTPALRAERIRDAILQKDLPVAAGVAEYHAVCKEQGVDALSPEEFTYHVEQRMYAHKRASKLKSS